LPNDRVDVVLSRRTRSTDGSPDAIATQTVLSNIRVLAIDQAPKEKNGQTAVVGKTATLELKPDEVAVLAKARASGTLSLALRSIADGKPTNVAAADSNTVTIYRGSASQEALTCDPLCH
jgi:pilus assembly protein CpaB